MSEDFPKPKPLGENVKFELNLPNQATKIRFKKSKRR